jgi:hypothetical protein
MRMSRLAWRFYVVAAEHFVAARIYISGNCARAESLSVWVALKATARMRPIYYFRQSLGNLSLPRSMGMFWGWDWE